MRIIAMSILLVGWLMVPSAFGAKKVFVDSRGQCAGLKPCFTTIQDGVDHAGPSARSSHGVSRDLSGGGRSQ